ARCLLAVDGGNGLAVVPHGHDRGQCPDRDARLPESLPVGVPGCSCTRGAGGHTDRTGWGAPARWRCPAGPSDHGDGCLATGTAPLPHDLGTAAAPDVVVRLLPGTAVGNAVRVGTCPAPGLGLAASSCPVRPSGADRGSTGRSFGGSRALPRHCHGLVDGPLPAVDASDVS